MNYIILQPGSPTDTLLSFLADAGIKTTAFSNAKRAFLQLEPKLSEDLKKRLRSLSPTLSFIEAPNYLLASRKLEKELKRVNIGGTVFDDKHIVVIAGPCSVTDDDTLLPTALRVQAAGASLIRGGIFKPRTSPYVFQGIGTDGLHLVDEVERAGMPFVSEVMGEEQIEILEPHISAFQVGARNMQNFNLLKALGKQTKPVVLKQGFGCTLVEFLNAAEYIMAGGNENVVLVVRGIRSFENATRFTLDIGAVAWLKQETRLPVIVDPSHAIGAAKYIASAAKGAIAAGADGLMLEVHNDPKTSISDANQALSLDAFETLMLDIEKIAHAVDRTIAKPSIVRLEESS